jgi:hypothetical protein
MHRGVEDLRPRFSLSFGSVHAISASRTNSSELTYEVEQKAIPILAVITASCPSTTNGMPNRS